MKPLQLFPRIPYRHQLARLSGAISRGEPNCYSADEVAQIRPSLPNHDAVTRCPRCREPLKVGGPVALQPEAAPVWVTRCDHCEIRMSVSTPALASQRRMRCGGLVHSEPPVTQLASRALHVAIAVVAHAFVITAAVMLTLPRAELATAPADTAMVLLAYSEAEQPKPVQLDLPEIPKLTDLKGFKTVAPPVVMPQQVNQADMTSQFDPRDFSGVGLEGGTFLGDAGGAVGETERDRGSVWRSTTLLDEPPVLISSPPPVYPADMRQSGLEGYVVLRFVIDTLGRAERPTVEIIKATHNKFVPSARKIIYQSRYRPGRVRGLPVRVLTTQRIDFSLRG
jgi:TonB family protein